MPPPNDDYSSDSSAENYSDDEFEHDSPAKDGGAGGEGKEKDRGPEEGKDGGERLGKGEGKDDCEEPMEGGGWKEIDFEEEITLLDQIGGGGVGLIYNGIWRGEKVALKTLFDPKVNDELKQEFMDELHIMSRVSHSNVVAFYGAALKPPSLCFVMELCKCSLFDLLHNSRTDAFTTHERLRFCHQIALGMDYLHNTVTPSIIHRDIKSHNILVDNDNNLKLCDFGLVRTLHTTAGTPNYMAPELFRNSTFSKAVDTYAFALVMWEIFTQELPYRGYDVEDIKKNVINGKRPEIPTLDVPQECQDMMRRGWSPHADDRPDFLEIVETLEIVLESTPIISELQKLEIIEDSLSEFM